MSLNKLSFQSPELEYHHEVMGRLNKFDTEVKVEIIHSNQLHIAANTSSPPPSSTPVSSSASSLHPVTTTTTTTTSYLTGNIYDSYGTDYGFEKIPSSPENDLNAYNVTTQYSPGASTSIKSTPKEYICINELADEVYMRPPLWEDITSSIQNIDPENAIMLGSMATQVKMESNESEHYMEPMNTTQLLSPLEIKSEIKNAHRLHNMNGGISNNSNIHMSSLNPHHSQSHHAHHLHSNQSHELVHSGVPLHLLHSNCSQTMQTHNDDNNNSAYNALCSNEQYTEHMDNGAQYNFGTTNSHESNVIMPLHAQHHHNAQHHSHHQLMPPSLPLHQNYAVPQQNSTNASYYNWTNNQTTQVSIEFEDARK